MSSKYRPLFVPLQVVLLFDIALLVVNFRISAQLEELSVQINVAGPQHMLSRQLPKAILMVERQVAEGNAESVVLAEWGVIRQAA